MKTWNTPWASLVLGREPYDTDPTLQAWTAADLLLARQALEVDPEPDRLHVVFNDPFGALGTLFVHQGRTVAQVSDSSLTQRCTLVNLEANGLAADGLFLLDSLTIPGGDPHRDHAPRVFLRLPKGHALLDYQLRQIRSILPEGSVLASAAMAKDIHTATLDLFEKILGPTTTSPAEQKARLILTTIAPRDPGPAPYPVEYRVEALGLDLISAAGVFSSSGLDGGTELLLRHFPRIPAGPATVVDLGCGNGVLGLAAARTSPEASVYCIDESFLAVWSARESFRRNGLGHRGFFLAGDGLEDFDRHEVDLVLCNPPFHHQNAQTQAIAHQMFRQARQVLKPRGELWVVANRHLGYHRVLAQAFGSVATAGVDERFVVLRARP